MESIPITRAATLKEKPKDETALGFGSIFTDHMLVMDYEEGSGWGEMRIEPYAPFSMDPAATVLHYGQAIFEGLKCYHTGKGLLLFRPRDNFARMNVSADRLSIPPIDPELCLKGLLTLLDLERAWVPRAEGASLYIRPTIIATDASLSVRASKKYRFFIILSPSGAYYPGGLAPIGIHVEDDYVRAVRGGIGFTKAAANYAASLYAGEAAAQKGYAQVLWLDGVERRYIEEVGSMNIMFAFGNEIITPALNGSILRGITRDSILRIARDMGIAAIERRVSIDELVQGAKSGALTEAFGTGTAAVVAPVGALCYRDTHITIGSGGIGRITQALYDRLTGIQRGSQPDVYEWTMEV